MELGLKSILGVLFTAFIAGARIAIYKLQKQKDVDTEDSRGILPYILKRKYKLVDILTGFTVISGLYTGVLKNQMVFVVGGLWILVLVVFVRVDGASI